MTSKTIISSWTVFPPSDVVPWAGERLNAVSPPKRSIRCARTSAYFSVRKGRPLLSLRGNSISTRCILSALETQQSEHEQQRAVIAIEISNEPRATQPVREKEKYGL